MDTNTSSMQFVDKQESPLIYGPRLLGIYQKVIVSLWLLITITSLISLALSIYSLNLWDRVPAAEAPRYFPEMTQEDVQAHADWQNTVLQRGFSLSGYALIFSIARLIGGLSLFLVSFLLIHRYSDHLMAVLIAILLSVFAAAGIWGNPLFGWGVPFAPWLSYPVQVLGWLLWCGAIVIYTFPDGIFTPRWTLGLTILLVPLAFLITFNLDIVLNPNNWPGPLYLLPNLFFIGGGLWAILYRYRHTVEAKQKQAMRWYMWGISPLIVVYFINLLMTDVYYLVAGQSLFQGNSSILTYVLLNEPIWFACETFFAVGLALSVFRDNLLRD